jgi:hypothetical protein
MHLHSFDLKRKNSINIYVKLGSRVRTQIGVHSSNGRPLMSLSQITVWFKGILKSAFFPNSQIYGWPIYWLALGLGHTSVKSLDVRPFEEWTPIWVRTLIWIYINKEAPEGSILLFYWNVCTKPGKWVVLYLFETVPKSRKTNITTLSKQFQKSRKTNTTTLSKQFQNLEKQILPHCCLYK